jgi:hypothetical protein
MGLLAAVGYAVKQYAVPRLAQWYKEWRSNSDEEDAEAQQQRTAQLVASAIQAQVSCPPEVADMFCPQGALIRQLAAAVARGGLSSVH